MSANRHSLGQTLRDLAGTWGLGAVILAAGFFVAYQFVGPPPPEKIVMATGQPGGAYQFYSEKYAFWLKSQGIEVELRETAGSVDNLQLLEAGEVDIGFVQGGLAGTLPTENVVAIGSLYLEPLWLFVNDNFELESIGDFVGKRIAVGAQGSGTRAVVINLFGAYGIDADSAEFNGLAGDALSGAFAANEIDAAFLIGAAESGAVKALLEQPGVTLRSFERTDAYVRRYPFLSKIHLPQGVLDLEQDIPDTDIDMVALTAQLAANKELHPALVDLLLIAATNIHGQHSLLADAGQFPTPQYTDLPLSEEAQRHFKRGPPFLMQYLPFWAATLVDRLWVLLLPLIGLAIPLVKVLSPAYRWRIRRRILRLYGALEQIDPLVNPIRDADDLSDRQQRLEQLDTGSVIENVPKTYTDDVYKLRRDIDLVRRRLEACGIGV
jgi:TRAP transporter TAXI family solute receptor